jgi:hypothetical protein
MYGLSVSAGTLPSTLTFTGSRILSTAGSFQQWQKDQVSEDFCSSAFKAELLTIKCHDVEVEQHLALLRRRRVVSERLHLADNTNKHVSLNWDKRHHGIGVFDDSMGVLTKDLSVLRTTNLPPVINVMAYVQLRNVYGQIKLKRLYSMDLSEQTIHKINWPHFRPINLLRIGENVVLGHWLMGSIPQAYVLPCRNTTDCIVDLLK